jgi:hypothetical protein
MAHFATCLGLADRVKGDRSILELAPAEIPDDPATAAESIFAQTSGDAHETASRALAFAQRHRDHAALFSGARRLVFTKAAEAHEYKYPAAAFEDVPNVSPAWRPHMVAASTLFLPASTAPDSEIIQRAKDAVANL